MERKITALKAQKKNRNRVSVYLDGEYAFGLARLVAAWLSVGETLSEEKIESLQHQDTIEVAYQKAIRFLSYRSRSEYEVNKRLTSYGFTPSTISKVTDRLRTTGLINDDEFARNWVENRSAFRPRSHYMLAMELRQKGVENDVIQAAISEIDDDETLAYLAAQKYARRLSGLEWRDFRKRLGAYLGRKGFSYGTVAIIVQRIWSEAEEENSAVSSTIREEK
jgi:regulatory protein